ncbi:F-box protein pallbearer isoform X2 [Arctopsyche grandis]|uniref:F-box protein pallbearer isoform X2 n=1 Tax=Arctopsyche grandis TaxID=121162 RepID=UPI00406D914F
MNILSLPTVMLEHIFSFLTYDQVAKNRVVCKDFDMVSQRVLNRGFQKMDKRLTANMRAIKAQLPRRESERRFHPLSRHCDLLASIETRFSMLSMAYSRFVEQGMCCFIPGKVLDEFRHVVTVVDECNPLPLAFEVLQELRDISGMAIEHFEEVVAPSLRQKMQEYANGLPPLPLVMRSEVEKKSSKVSLGSPSELALLREACLKNNKNILKMEKKYIKLTRKLELNKRLMALNKRQMLQRQTEQGHKIAELKKKVEEYEVKFNELSLNQYVGYKTCIKEPDTRDRISNMLAKTNKMLNIKMRLRNIGSQIKLDPSPSRIGPNKGSPITKPRKAGLNLPSPKSTDDSVIPETLSKFTVANVNIPQKDQFAGAVRSAIFKEYPWMRNMLRSQNELASRDSISLPSTSKSISSDDSDLQVVDFPIEKSSSSLDGTTGGKKRVNSEADDDTMRFGVRHRGVQAKVQLLSRTIMNLAESMSYTPFGKRRRLQEDQE